MMANKYTPLFYPLLVEFYWCESYLSAILVLAQYFAEECQHQLVPDLKEEITQGQIWWATITQDQELQNPNI